MGNKKNCNTEQSCIVASFVLLSFLVPYFKIPIKNEERHRAEQVNIKFLDMAVNNTLQRSAYSFRRQGSSGRIWDDSYLSKSCELVTPRKIQDSRFSCDLNKTQRPGSRFAFSCELNKPSRFNCNLNKTQCQSSMSLQRQSSLSLQCHPSIPLQPAPSRKQRVQRARPRTFECLSCFRRCVS